jgi:hypothetical protein
MVLFDQPGETDLQLWVMGVVMVFSGTLLYSITGSDKVKKL